MCVGHLRAFSGQIEQVAQGIAVLLCFRSIVDLGFQSPQRPAP